MEEKEASIPPNKIRTWRLGFAWGTVACFLAALATLVLFQGSGNIGMLYVTLGLLGLGFLCGITVAILNSKERKSLGIAPHNSEFGLAMGITLIVFIAMLIFAFFGLLAALNGFRG